MTQAQLLSITDDTTLTRIADRLNALTNAVTFTLQYPDWIDGYCGEGASWAIGTANDDLGADYYQSEDHANGPLFSLSVPLDDDPIVMADALFALMVQNIEARRQDHPNGR